MKLSTEASLNQSLQFHYTVLGDGPEMLLAFHGIGQTGGECYKDFAKDLGDRFTIIAVDLPWHGETYVAPDLDLISPNQLCLSVEYVLNQLGVERFSLIGYSLGSRLAFTVHRYFHSRINKAYFVASDGITVHPIYKFATGTSMTRKLFYTVMIKGRRTFLTIVDWLCRLKLLHPSVAKLTTNLIGTEEGALQVFHCWVGFRQFQLLESDLNTSIKASRANIYVVIGQYDAMITAKRAARLTQHLPDINLLRFPSGHGSILRTFGLFLSKQEG